MTPQKSPRLDRKLVADTALRLLDEVGLDGLTLRAIAAELDVKAPALYWHFKDKQALLDEMATEMMRRMDSAGEPPVGDWRKAYRAAMHGLRAQLLRYRDGARVYSGARFTDTSYAAGLDAGLRLLVDAGFTLTAAARAWYTGYSYTIGYTVEQQAMGPNPFVGEAGYDLEARAERLAAHPLAAAAGPVMFGDFDEGYAQGLEAILVGIDTWRTGRA
ncbi:TetR/AcrR family transcriptional regulator C-terminal domain-containing protein [Kitasatospora sp. NPDC101176]|uniref:TetR/AcrR family transcriptional regulator C-terminal domain-containing protein n=1 Tax=Kitasatospora sp. NPDC101176 TaxID=3364099 RepID=UPI0038195C65